MSRRRSIVLVAAAIIAATGATAAVHAHRNRVAVIEQREEAQYERAVRSADIAFYMRRASEDPMSAEDRVMAAGLLLQRAREGGGRPDYRLARDYASASIALRSSHNGKARLALASALLAQHEFPEALAVARELVADAPDEPRYRALLAELLVEIGEYDEAGAQFDTLTPHLASLAIAPRYARYLEFRGKNPAALRVLAQALVDALKEPGLPAEQVAWFGLRLADAQLRTGSVDAAGRTLDASLRRSPDDARLWSLKARWHAVRQDWRETLAAVDRAGDGADLQTTALAGDAWAALGDTGRATRMWAATESSALENPEPFNRQWTLFRLEHAVELDETRALLERESTGRRDVFGWGQLAFARLLTGDPVRAEEAVQRSLSLGTGDAWLWYVAGRVAEACGRVDESRARYERALSLNPAFHHRFAADARARLTAMQ